MHKAAIRCSSYVDGLCTVYTFKLIVMNAHRRGIRPMSIMMLLEKERMSQCNESTGRGMKKG